MTPKIISYDVEIKSTSKLWVQKVPEVYTNDSNSVEIQFNLVDCTEAELLNSTAQVLLYMRDGSFFQNTGADVVRTGTTFSYTLKDNEGNHQGLTEVQLVLKIVGTPDKDYASQMYQFKIKNGLGNNVPVETFIQTWETLTTEANAFIAQMETDVQEFDVALENGVLATNIAAKLNNLEITYAPRLLSAEQQLAHLDDTKADLADLPSSAYLFKGSTTFAALPTTGNTLGDVRWTTDNLLNYAWTGTAWTPIGNGAFADGSVVTKKLANGATTAPKTDFFNSLNVYNPDTIVSGSYLTGATITALAIACYSDKIPVKKGDVISLLNFPNTTFGSNVGAIYDANDVVVFGLTGTNKAAESITINATGATYIRVNNTLANLFKIMVTVNQTITKFIPYGEQSLIDAVKTKQNEYNQIMSGCLTILEPNSSHIPYPDNVASMSTVKIDALNTFKNTITSTGYVGIKKVLDAWAIKTDKIKIKLKLKVVSASYPVTVAPFILAYPNKTFDSGTGTGKNGKTITVVDANVVEIEQTITFDPFVSIKGLIGGIFVVSGTGDFYINQMVLDFDYINDHNPLFGKKIVGNGDSIMYGAGEVGGFVKIIAERNGMTYQNVGVSGGTITYGTKYGDNVTPRHWICNTITSMDADADFVILEGGINDYFNGIPMGAITADFDDAIDNTTFYGALESIFRQAIPRFTVAKILFVVNHNANVIASTDNGTGSGRTFEVYYQAILAVCKKYGIDVVDLYKNSGMITFYTAVKNTYTNTSDGVHPNLAGYKKYYVPPIEYKMREISYSV